MMHLNDFITYISIKGQPVREYNPLTGTKNRCCDIYLSPGTEYEFGFKNQCDKRRRINIFIDGTKAVDSLIIDAFHQLSLERFFDTNKKFMTAIKSDSRVSDPTNKDIGKIKIEVYKENTPDKPVYKGLLRLRPGTLRGCLRGEASGSSASDGASESSAKSVNYSCSLEDQTLGFENVAPSNLAPSNLATIEGGKSNQKLVSVTWYGDDIDSLLTFHYNLLEKNAELQNSTHKFCTNCGNKSELNHKFCAKCGKKF